MSHEWRAWIRETVDGWRWEIRASEGRRWTGVAESFARATEEAGAVLRREQAQERTAAS